MFSVAEELKGVLKEKYQCEYEEFMAKKVSIITNDQNNFTSQLYIVLIYQSMIQLLVLIALKSTCIIL